MIPLISFDALINVYLTIMFLIPLKSKLTWVFWKWQLEWCSLTSTRTLLLYQHGENASQYSSSDSGIPNILRHSLHASKQHCVRVNLQCLRNRFLVNIDRLIASF
jgi:hypothetical protein